MDEPGKALAWWCWLSQCWRRFNMTNLPQQIDILPGRVCRPMR